jgi:hypothetical protein
MTREPAMKHSRQLLDLGKASRKTKGMNFVMFHEAGMFPYNWWFLW